MSIDYGKTLNLPKSDFPMRANLPQREPGFLEKWEQQDVYNKQLKKNEGKPKFILHDGPPYANGGIHLGTALNKILKDMIVKYHSMNGCYTPYTPGWDTHGLPTEHRAIKDLGLNRNEVGPVVFRNGCRDIALKYLDVQREAFKRLGVRGDWDNPYITLTKDFEAMQIEVFGEMVKKGYVYKGLRPVYWCPDCETALAEAEIEYMQDESLSIYVKFPIKDDKGVIKAITGTLDNVHVLIWTTTTWTLPGNLAISLNPSFSYSVVQVKDEYYVMATELIESVMNAAGVTEYKEVGKVQGSDLEYVTCQHPFLDRESLIILGDHVTLEAGTGCVHTAPGFGADDFQVSQRYKLPVIVPVDSKGKMTADAGDNVAGMFYKKANKVIYKDLEEREMLFASEDLTHQYPHCWRCKSPIIFRATEQWFVSIDAFRDDALKEIKNVRWLPDWGQERITSMVKDRSDWCISRQRIWGVPIPIFYCVECNKELVNDDTINRVKELFTERGSNGWFELSAEEILGGAHKCECGCSEFKKEQDIMDVWFDSGSTHHAVLENDRFADLERPADLYLEGSDQHRGWFQSSLLTSVAMGKGAPYKAVLTHGYVVDGEGRKMSKSVGNGIDPDEIISQYGADILRLWVASSDYKTDIRISKELLKQLSEVYRKIRNTAKYILGNISDFDPNVDQVAYEDMQEIDKWALGKTYGLLEKVNDSYKNYEFHMMFHAIHNFCVVDMSNFYLDIIKDRLYTSKPESQVRKSAQTSMYIILDALVRMLAPVLSFTTEEIWGFMPHVESDDTESIQLNDWPVLDEVYSNKELLDKWKKIIKIRSDVSKALETARANKVIGHSLNAKVTIFADEETYDFVDSIKDSLVTIFITSGFELKTLAEASDAENLITGEEIPEMKVKVDNAEGDKCDRCWMFSETVGKDSEHPQVCGRCISNLV